MPYIPQGDRERLIVTGDPETPGELNYVITVLVNNYWEDRKNYSAINDILGALQGASNEFYRRVAIPYEDTKIEQNGDVYD